MIINNPKKISILLTGFCFFNPIALDAFAEDFKIAAFKEKQNLNTDPLEKNNPLISNAIIKKDNVINGDELIKEVIEAIDNSPGNPNFQTIKEGDSKNKFINSDIHKKLEKKESISQVKKEEEIIIKWNKNHSGEKNVAATSKQNKNVNLEFGDISVGGFRIPPRGYVDIDGPNISLNLQKANSIDTLKLLSERGGFGFILIKDIVAESSTESENEEKGYPTITANFSETKFSHVFNSILMASGLQAKIENNIIFIGKNINNKSLRSKYSKTYRLNQASAASVGDYLATLGAKISKVLVKGSAVVGDELGNELFSGADLSENFINSYGTTGGPLNGLIGTVDLRLQTITLIGNKNLISNAEKYIKKLDARQKQVALSVKIIDVSLTKNDMTYNNFELRSGSQYITNQGGLDFKTGNLNTWGPPTTPTTISSIIDPSYTLQNNEFFNWLQTKIKNENAKIVASPTLVLGENADPILSGAAAVDDELGSATIGRPFANEAFIKVGETVATSFSVTTTDGVTTCTASNGTSGITFGAKVDKIDDNGYVTFSLSPAISSVTSTIQIAGCGTQSTLSVRKLDTGSIRVKNGETLILTGVLKDEDNITTSKVPILGDVPILGRFFRENDTVKRKSELIILVTPRIIND